MKHTIIALLVLASTAPSVTAESPRDSFAKSWKGQSVVVKTMLYSLIYNERGKLGTTRTGRREGLLVVTSSNTEHLQFDGRQGRNTVISKDPELLVKKVFAAYEPDALDVRAYRKLEPLAIHRFEPGVELIVGDVFFARDEVKFEFVQQDGGDEAVTSIRVKWPLPLSPAFSERLPLEDLLRRFIERKPVSP
jgi:hypothetical protein